MAQHDSELMAQQQQSALRYSKRSTQPKLTILLSIAKLLYYSNFKAGNGLATGSFEKAVTKQGVRTTAAGWVHRNDGCWVAEELNRYLAPKPTVERLDLSQDDRHLGSGVVGRGVGSGTFPPT